MLELLYFNAYIRGVGKTFDLGRGAQFLIKSICSVRHTEWAWYRLIYWGGTLQAGHIFHSFLVCLHNMFIVPYIATVLVLLLHILGGRMKDSTGCCGGGKMSSEVHSLASQPYFSLFPK